MERLLCRAASIVSGKHLRRWAIDGYADVADEDLSIELDDDCSRALAWA